MSLCRKQFVMRLVMEDIEDEVDGCETLSSDVKIGEFCSSDIQVAINEGNRQRHAFFVAKMVKIGVAKPYQQLIPAYFSKHHFRKLHPKDITLEISCGRSWSAIIRPSRKNVWRIGKGWKQFAVANHLRVGHQLLFHLVSSSQFVIHFFDHLGKCHDSFDGAPPFAKPPLQTAAAKPPRLPVATPSETVPVAAFPITNPKTLRPRTTGLNSDDAKVILSQFFTQAHLGNNEEQATEQGKAYVFIGGDDDDEPVNQESLTRASIRRDSFQKSYSGELTEFRSLEKDRTPRLARNMMLVEYGKQGGFDNHSTKSMSYRNNKADLERQRSPVRKKLSIRRGSWESKADHDIVDMDFDGHDDRRSIREKSPSRDCYLKELGRDHGPTASGGQSQFLAHLSPAKVLLTQQGCLNYSELIVSERRRSYVTDEALQRTLTAATIYAAGLKTQSFLVVMEDHHVYHEFQLSIPREFLEATGTLTANKVCVCLMDNQGTCYETKWKWHASCQTPYLNCDGWALFALDHMLEEGDVCVFELVAPGPAFHFSVHIFKIVAAETNSRRASFIRAKINLHHSQKLK